MAFYCSKLDRIVVAFRGSVKKNWLQNFQILLSDYSSTCSHCKVHQGFLKHSNSLLGGVLEAVTKLLLKYPNVTILITGHSLGGALAQLLGLQIKKAFNTTLSLYTFGSPRVGNKQLAEFTDRTFRGHFRVVNWKDAVPHILPKRLGFKHAGSELHSV